MKEKQEEKHSYFTLKKSLSYRQKVYLKHGIHTWQPNSTLNRIRKTSWIYLDECHVQ